MQINAAPGQGRVRKSFTILLLILLAATILGSLSGAVVIPVQQWWPVLTGGHGDETQLLRQIFLDIRLPRVVFGIVTGAALALSGVVMQALFRNPLAEPGLIGVSAGAALGAVSAIVLTAAGFWVISFAAFAGSLLSTWLAYLVGRRYAGVAGLLLAGIAINAISGSLIGLLTYIATDTQLRDLTFWGMGSLASANWRTIAFLGPWTLVICLLLCREWRALNALLLGEREVTHLGFSMKHLRRRLIVGIALLVGPLVAVTGGIGFVGLVVPHCLRMIMGANHRHLLPASMAGGALALVLADWLARVVVIPAELPIGLVTSLIGGPFFLWLLVKRNMR
ncbi:hemin ABC transporter permease [Advenella kashmirensis WT001]|uniref:Hemin ABC transporter permease n=1 Tax=Advenella kashmirensis (strain DSM 17095 / LMG 22695 / WT001) TaxID=1036672 RepID=I3UEW4_ADVKW|nr:hemin ABC transporter permease [Advenella kashmirensis WT001]